MKVLALALIILLHSLFGSTGDLLENSEEGLLGVDEEIVIELPEGQAAGGF